MLTSSATNPTPNGGGADLPRVSIVGLVAMIHIPYQAGSSTRTAAPRGYGIAEHCLPFVEAAACGLAIPSPFSWGVCDRSELPQGARPFRSPMSGDLSDDRCYYVIDEPHLSFRGNQFHPAREVVQRIGSAPLPGLSFFDRSDQTDLIKIHLPYSWRTAEGTMTLFLPPINRPREDGLRVITGLVETAWYANPVNLVVQIPRPPAAVHVIAGEQLAQAIPLPRSASRPDLEALELHRRDTRDRLDAIKAWRDSLHQHRNAYKRTVLTRRQGRSVVDRRGVSELTAGHGCVKPVVD